MRTITYFDTEPAERVIVPIGNGKRAWVFIRTDIQHNVVLDEEGERDQWSAVEWSAQVNSLDLVVDDAFVQALIAVETERAAADVRAARDRLLDATDNEMLMDRAEPDTDYYDAISDYRAALRAMPDQPGFPFDVTWPARPTRGAPVAHSAADQLKALQGAIADTDAMTVDQELRITMLELGLDDF